MYYQEFKYPTKYEMVFYGSFVKLWVDKMGGMVKAQVNNRTHYKHIDDISATFYGVSKEQLIQKMKG